MHGGHNRPDDDGRPGGLTLSSALAVLRHLAEAEPATSGNDVLIEPGGSRTYHFEGMEDGEPERGAFQWYHDHRLDHTSTNSWHGLTGMWIVDEPGVEGPLNLPPSGRDIPLMITDRTLRHAQSAHRPVQNPGRPADRPGPRQQILVNGAPTPHKPVKARRYRLRLLNTSSFRSYNLALDSGLEMVQICSEAGLMPKALKRKKILIGPAERVEVVVDFAKARGKHVKLRQRQALRPKAARSSARSPTIGELMEFRVGASTQHRHDRDPRAAEGAGPLRALPQWAHRRRGRDPAPEPDLQLEAPDLAAHASPTG